MSRYTLVLAALLLLALPTAAPAGNAKARYSAPYLLDDPDSTADRGRRLEPGEPVTTGRREGRYVHVRTRNGDSGWVRSSQLR
ncbi:hypothetical protein KBTX_00634 [wastewater metagenome]|uniref:SH3b domain-containing protein n=2 Tax=unclassified sequences TaxID=12908 RepID=A0A5B8R6M2_9ZZZZ|nr:SH3 domain-containing protein [Arhodomonas sp. KWT]QEA04326.1 hypothetical protein KBTEX_00634 [uncultured organism]